MHFAQKGVVSNNQYLVQGIAISRTRFYINYFYFHSIKLSNLVKENIIEMFFLLNFHLKTQKKLTQFEQSNTQKEGKSN